MSQFPSSLSPSRAGDFMNCPLLYRFRTIDKLPEEPSAAQLRGTLLHTALENLFDLPPVDRTPSAVIRLAESALATMGEEEPESADIVLEAGDFTTAIRPLVDSYFSMEDPRRLEPHGREIAMSVELDSGFHLRGFIDRVDVAPEGDVRIVDYKTGKSPRAGYESKALFQMRFYALTWWRAHDRIPRLLQLLYLGNAEIVRHAPTEQELLATERKVLALREAIASAASSAHFAPAPSKLCDWCSHKSICPAWGGTPPPMPDVEVA